MCSSDLTAFDNDCDGMIDEDCAEACSDGAMRACYTGRSAAAGRGECALGTQTCSGGAWSTCTGSVLPEDETCANPGADDDCNGEVDDIEGEGEGCLDEMAMGVCRRGARTCDMGVLECVTPSAAPMEACDARDDDCDGLVDEGFDFMNSEDHCGGCGLSCGPAQTCCMGVCTDTESDVARGGASWAKRCRARPRRSSATRLSVPYPGPG